MEPCPRKAVGTAQVRFLIVVRTTVKGRSYPKNLNSPRYGGLSKEETKAKGTLSFFTVFMINTVKLVLLY